MTLGTPILTLSIAIALIAALLANLWTFWMIREVNRRIGDEPPVRFIANPPQEFVRLFREYRRLYPDGRLHWYICAAVGVCVVCFFAIVAAVEIL